MKHFFNTYKIIILQTLITFFNLKIQNSSNENDDYQIKFVFEIMRHGARSPEILISSSSSEDEEEIYDLFHEKWPDGPTELTSLGIRQHFLIGYRNYLRYIKKYKFLNENYDPDEIQLISTPLNRTIMSMNAEIHGMFLPGNGPRLNNLEESDYAVPPLIDNDTYIDEKEDLDDSSDSFAAIKERPFVLPVYTFNPEKFNTQRVKTEHCKALKKVYKKRHGDKKYNDFYKKFNESKYANLTNLKKKIGTNISFHDFISNLSDAAIADYTDNRTLNIVENFHDFEFDEDEFKDFVENYAFNFSYLEYIGNIEEHDKKIAQVAASQLFEYILDWMNNIINNKKQTPKFVIYSMHETNLGPFTFFLKNALKFKYPEKNFVNYANFSANAHLELYYKKSEKKYYVNYLFNDQSIINITFDDFEKNIKNFIMNDDEIHYYCNEENKNDYIVVISILSSIVVILIITLVIIYFKKKKNFNSIEKINSFDLYEN